MDVKRCAIDLRATPSQGEAVIYQVIEDEAVLLNLDNGYYYSLDPLGSEIWAMCTGTRSLHAMLDRLCDEYDVTQDQAQRDLLDLVNDLWREGLVSVHEFEPQA